MKVSILSNGLGIYPSRAFLLPILTYQSKLESEGVEISISQSYSHLELDCDVLIVEDNVFTRQYDTEDILSRIKGLAGKVARILWFDTDDSTGTITPGILPIVDGYYKKQLLKDRERYCEPQWRARTYTDYYYSNYNLDTENAHGKHIVGESKHSSNDLFESFLTGFT